MKRLIALLMAALIMMTAMPTVFAEETADTITPTGEIGEGTDTEDLPLEGLIINGGKKYYYENNVAVTNVLKVIDGKKYYFGADGAALVSTIKAVDGSKYYFNAKGYAATSGLTTVDGKKYYFTKSGAALVKTLKTISGKTYYFNKYGYAATSGLTQVGTKYYYFQKTGEAFKGGWKTISGKKYYFQSTGIAATGVKKIGTKYYGFTSKGVKRTTNFKVGTKQYYISNKSTKHIEAYSVGSTYYKPNGKKMTAREKLDYTTFLEAKKVVAKICKPSQTKAQKLMTCFKWVQAKNYGVHRIFDYDSLWPAIYGMDHFNNINGDCHSDGGALAYLARAIGYTNVYAVLDTNRANQHTSHAWTEIDGKVYDPLFAEGTAHGGYARNYGASYSVFECDPITRVRVAVGY